MTNITNFPYIINDVVTFSSTSATGQTATYPSTTCCDVSPLPAVKHTISTELVTKVNNVNKVNPGESNMCEGLIMLPITLLIGYVIGRGFDWRYKIVKGNERRYEIWYKPALWPFWFEGPCASTLPEAKSRLEIFKQIGTPVEG